MAQPSYPARNAFQNRLPDRTVPSSSQAQFGQSAPGPAPNRQPPFVRLPQQPAYNSYSQYAPGAGYGTGRGQVQPPLRAVGTVAEHEDEFVLTDEQRDEINEAFTIFDLDHDEQLDLHELRVAFRALGFVVEKPEVSQLMLANGVPKPNAQMMNAGGRGNASIHPVQMVIGRDAFTMLATQKMSARDPRDEVNRAYDLFDSGNKGYINLEDLRRIARELGETSLEEQELRTMIEEFAYENANGITRDEFLQICLQ